MLTKMESGIMNGVLPEKSAILEMQSSIDTIVKNAALYEEKNFNHRTDAIDFIGFRVIDQIEELLAKTIQREKLISLKHRAEKIKSELEEINTNLFKGLRTIIRTGRFSGKECKNMIGEYFDLNSVLKDLPDEPAYDNLDIFINGLFSSQSIPDQTIDLETEMVYYQKTPARVVFELVEKFQFRKDDVFSDLGAGLGQPAILVNLLAGIKAIGIEIEPAFCSYARNCAKELNLSQVEFIQADARKADYTEGNIFFMFTPFKGKILEEVLEILRKVSLLRKIRIISYGPCTAQVALQSWLQSANPQPGNIYQPGIFSSL
jgi:precorrin-6B methylase 2